MKHLFVNIPNNTFSWIPLPSVSAALGVLEKEGIDAEFIDFRMIYNSYIVSQQGLQELLSFYENFYKMIDSDDLISKMFPQEIKQEIIKRLRVIKTVSGWMDFCIDVVKNNVIASRSYNINITTAQEELQKRYLEVLNPILEDVK